MFRVLLVFSRPRQVKDVAHQEEVVRTLTNTLETGNVSICEHCVEWVYCDRVLECGFSECGGWLQLPHLLFYGPPGTGKTTTALAICHQLFG